MPTTTMLVQRTETLLFWGLILLLVWTPFAFGAVHAWAVGLIQVHVFLLTALWMLHRLYQQTPRQRLSGDWDISFTFAGLLLALFVSLAIVQLIPLPPKIINWLSPTTYRTYHQFLPTSTEAYFPLSLYPTATRAGLVQGLVHIGLFIVVVFTVNTPRKLRFVYRAIVSIAILMALLAIVQKLSGTSSIFWLRDTSYSEFFGPYVNRNHCAAYLAMALPIGLGLLMMDMPRRGGRATVPSRPGRLGWVARARLWTGQRVLWSYGLATIATAICLALSRGALLSLGFGWVILMLLLRKRKDGLKHRQVWGLTLVMMVGMALWLGLAPLLNRLSTAVDAQQEFALMGRVEAWQATWKMLMDFPLFGIGYAAFPVVFPKYQIDGPTGRFLHAHNDPLQLLAETGLFGGIAFMGALVLIMIGVLKRWQRRSDVFVKYMVPAGCAALSTMALHALVDFNFHIPANALLFTVVLGLTCACVKVSGSDQVTQDDAQIAVSRRTRPCLALVLTLGMTATIWLVYGGFRTFIADLLYPQHQVLQDKHWLRQADADTRRHRLQQALEWVPEYTDYWFHLAQIDAQHIRQTRQTETNEKVEPVSMQFAQVDRLYQRVVQQRPTDPYTQIARLSLWTSYPMLNPVDAFKDDEERIAFTTELAKLAPSEPSIHYALGLFLLVKEVAATPALTTFFQRAIELDERYIKRVLHAHLKYLPMAEALYRFDLSLPRTILAYLKAARLLEEQLWSQARMYYVTALAMAPSDPHVLRTYGEALHRHGMYSLARELWEQLQQIAPDDATAYLKLADVYHHLDDGDALLNTLHRLVTRFPTRAEYLAKLASTYLQLDKPTDAAIQWRKYRKQFPYDLEGYLGLARVYTYKEDYASAIDIMRKAVNMAPGTVASHRYLAHLYQQIGAANMALREYQRLETFQPDNPEILYQIGGLLRRVGDNRRAREYYRRAVQLKPTHQGFRRSLDKLEAQMSKKP